MFNGGALRGWTNSHVRLDRRRHRQQKWRWLLLHCDEALLNDSCRALSLKTWWLCWKGCCPAHALTWRGGDSCWQLHIDWVDQRPLKFLALLQGRILHLRIAAYLRLDRFLFQGCRAANSFSLVHRRGAERNSVVYHYVGFEANRFSSRHLSQVC